MSETASWLAAGFVLGLVLLLFGPPVYRAWQQQRHNALEYQRAWNWLATRTHLVFERGQYSASPRLVGPYRGRALTLNLLLADGSPARTFTRLHLALPPRLAESRLTLVRRTRLAALWPRREPDEFLRRFNVAAEPQQLGLELLASAGLKRKLLDARDVQIGLQADGLRLLTPGIVADPEYLAYLFDVLSDVARLLERAHPSEAPAELAGRARNLAEAETA